MVFSGLCGVPLLFDRIPDGLTETTGKILRDGCVGPMTPANYIILNHFKALKTPGRNLEAKRNFRRPRWSTE